VVEWAGSFCCPNPSRGKAGLCFDFGYRPFYRLVSAARGPLAPLKYRFKEAGDKASGISSAVQEAFRLMHSLCSEWTGHKLGVGRGYRSP
jgi:hypothetical protein